MPHDETLSRGLREEIKALSTWPKETTGQPMVLLHEVLELVDKHEADRCPKKIGHRVERVCVSCSKHIEGCAMPLPRGMSRQERESVLDNIARGAKAGTLTREDLLLYAGMLVSFVHQADKRVELIREILQGA